MNKLQLFNFATELFQQNLITRIELKEFKAREKAINEIIDLEIYKNEKREDLELMKLKIIELIIDNSNILLKKIREISIGNSKTLDDKKKKMLNVLENNIIISTDMILVNYSNYLSIQTRKSFYQIENKNK